jgi:hypothetical protein
MIPLPTLVDALMRETAHVRWCEALRRFEYRLNDRRPATVGYHPRRRNRAHITIGARISLTVTERDCTTVLGVAMQALAAACSGARLDYGKDLSLTRSCRSLLRREDVFVLQLGGYRRTLLRSELTALAATLIRFNQHVCGLPAAWTGPVEVPR